MADDNQAAADAAVLDDSDIQPEFASEEGEDRKRSADEVVAYAHDEMEEEDDDDGDSEGGAKKRQRTSRKGRSAPPPKKLNNEQWDAMFEKLQAYKEEQGDCLVPKRYAANPQLGTWVETQRVQYKKLQKAAADSADPSLVTPSKRLNATRLEKLESIGFAWSAKNVRKPKPPAVVAKKKTSSVATDRVAARQRLNEVQWNEMYERLKKYKEEHGHCVVPKKYDQDPKLATWVETQRVLNNREYRKGQDGRITTDAAASLAPAGTVEGKSPEEWAAELEKGTGPIETATEEDVAEVVAATMEVVDQVTAATEEQVTAATEEQVTGTESEVGESAASGKTGKKLSEERKAKLDELGFVWSLRSKRVSDHWDEMFDKLVQYKEVHGDCLVPSRYEEDVKLGKWVETQRYEYTKLQRASAGEKGEGKEDDAIAEGATKSARATNPRLTEERLRRLESIGFEWKVKHKMKRYYDRQWDAMYERLLEFKKEHGHTMVPKRHSSDHKLGTWVHTQRIQYRKFLAGTKKGDAAESEDAGNDESKGDDEAKGDDEPSFRLTEERRKKLSDVGFVWSARETEKSSERSRITRNSYDEQWDAMFQRLQAYKETHGDVLVPKRCKEDQKLGTWVDTQRVQYKKMKKHLAKMGIDYPGPASEGEAKEDDEPPNTAPKPLVGRLTDERIRKLEGLGFVWSLRDDWQKHYNELIEYKRLHGHCNVPARYSANRRLGIWVSAQRQQYKLLNAADEMKKQRSAPLTAERIRLLNELGFTWTIRSRDSLGESWNQRLEELKRYKEEHGHCLVPSRYPPSPHLGVWVGTQRTQYRLFMKAKEQDPTLTQSSAMSEDRIRQLEELGFIWALRGGSDHVWRTRISELVDYKTAHGGDVNVPEDYPDNPSFAKWVKEQRIQYQILQEGKNSQLDPERVAELDSLGFIWETPVAGISIADAEDTIATASALAAAAASSVGDPTEEVEHGEMDVGIDV